MGINQTERNARWPNPGRTHLGKDFGQIPLERYNESVYDPRKLDDSESAGTADRIESRMDVPIVEHPTSTSKETCHDTPDASGNDFESGFICYHI